MKTPNQLEHDNVLTDFWNEGGSPYLFNINELCITVGCTNKEEIQLFKTVMKIEENKYMLSKGISEEHNQYSIKKGDGKVLSHTVNRLQDYL